MCLSIVQPITISPSQAIASVPSPTETIAGALMKIPLNSWLF
ncbi:uncharacterized protein METZ01_LOCUS119218, partial [marine metagenome]